jgi:hypothetical protein
VSKLSDRIFLRIFTGDGRWSRDAASFSPGASNATTGTPKVAPRSEAREPPRECPITYYIYEHDLIKGMKGVRTNKPYVGIWIHICYIVVKILQTSLRNDCDTMGHKCTHSANCIKKAISYK